MAHVHEVGHSLACQPYPAPHRHSRREHAIATVDKRKLVVALRETVFGIVVVDILAQVLATCHDGDFGGIVTDKALHIKQSGVVAHELPQIRIKVLRTI